MIRQTRPSPQHPDAAGEFQQSCRWHGDRAPRSCADLPAACNPVRRSQRSAAAPFPAVRRKAPTRIPSPVQSECVHATRLHQFPRETILPICVDRGQTPSLRPKPVDAHQPQPAAQAVKPQRIVPQATRDNRLSGQYLLRRWIAVPQLNQERIRSSGRLG